MMHKGNLFKITGLPIQLYASIVLSMTCFLSGFSISAYIISLLQSQESPLKAKKCTLLTTLPDHLPEIARMIVSFLPIFLSVYFNAKLGRRFLKIVFGLCFVLSWSLITLASLEAEIIIGQLISALVMGMDFITTYAYISEIPDDCRRGTMLSLPLLQATMGAFVSALLAMYASYKTINLLNISMSIVYLLLITNLKETPAVLLQQGKYKEAVDSLKFYRGMNTVTSGLLDELNRIKLDLFTEESSLKHGIVAVDVDSISEETLDPWQIFESSVAIRRAAYAATFQILLVSLMGAFTIQSYVVELFEDTSYLKISYVSCILALNASLMVGSGFGVLFIDLLPRRTLMIASSIFCTMALLLLSTLFRWKWAEAWTVPTVTLAFCCVYQIGVSNVAAVQMAEMFPSSVKVIVIMVSLSVILCAQFIALYTCELIIDRIGIDIGLFFFAVMGLLSTLWSYYFMKETRNVPVREIMDMYAIGYLYKNDHTILPLQIRK